MNRTLKKLVGGKKPNAEEETDQEFDEHRKQCEALLTIMDALRKQAKRFLDLCNELGPSMLAMAQSFERLYAEGADKVCGSKIMMAALRMDMASKDFQNETGQAVSRLERFYEVLHTQKKRLKQHDNYLSTYKKSVSALKSARSSGDPIRVERAEEKHKEAQRDYEQSHSALRTSLIRCNTKRTFFVNKSFTQIAKGSFQLFTASIEGVSMLEPVLDYSPTGEPLSPEDEADEDMQQAENGKNNNNNNKHQPPREDNVALSSTMTRTNHSAFSFSSSNPRRRSTTFSPTSSTPTTSSYTNPTNASTRVVSPRQRPVSTAYCNNFAFGDQPSRSPPLPPPSSSSYRQPQQPQQPQLPRPPTIQSQQYSQYQPLAPHHQPLPPRTSAPVPGFGPQQHHHHHQQQQLQPQQPNYSAAPTSSPLGLPPQLPPAPHRQAPSSPSSDPYRRYS
ncbi:Microtubule-associated protein futsch [Balamuthia mandrillaris]